MDVFDRMERHQGVVGPRDSGEDLYTEWRREERTLGADPGGEFATGFGRNVHVSWRMLAE